jgi:hypothetical protein
MKELLVNGVPHSSMKSAGETLPLIQVLRILSYSTIELTGQTTSADLKILILIP